MDRPKWPKLRHANPADIRDHAASLGNDFKAVHEFLRAGVSDIAPSLPKGIELKITKGIEKGLVEVESRDYSTTSISVDDRDIISNAILGEIIAETAAVFHNRVPQYLFKILHDSYNELKLKLVTGQDAAPQQGATMAGTASGEVLPHTPPESPLGETDSEVSVDYGSDTEGLAHNDFINGTNKLRGQAQKLKAQWQEVELERKVTCQRLRVKASRIEKEIEKVELEEKAADKRFCEALKVMRERRLEQDRTGDYGTGAVGYKVDIPMDLYFAKGDVLARFVTLGIEQQAAVNRLFNMPANVLLRKVKEAVKQKSTSVGDKIFPGIAYFLGAELFDDGNVAIWGNAIDEYDGKKFEGDAFEGLPEMPFWDQAIFASFASHVTQPYEIYTVEVKGITAQMVDLRNRKRKAAVITELVHHNVKAIPSLHIDLVKNIRFVRGTTNDNTQVLVLDLSDPVTANEVISHGLYWQGECYSCEVYDIKFFDRCGRCQEFGHHAHACSGSLRCGNCAGQHSTKVCTSPKTTCALCSEWHRFGTPRCRAKRARILDKLNARFPTAEDHQPLATPPEEPTGPSPSIAPQVTDIPIPQEETLNSAKECPPDSVSATVKTGLPDTPTVLARQLQDRIPAIEAALRSDVSKMRREASQGTCPIRTAVSRLGATKMGRRTSLTPLGCWATHRPDKPAPETEEEEEIL